MLIENSEVKQRADRAFNEGRVSKKKEEEWKKKGSQLLRHQEDPQFEAQTIRWRQKKKRQSRKEIYERRGGGIYPKNGRQFRSKPSKNLERKSDDLRAEGGRGVSL